MITKWLKQAVKVNTIASGGSAYSFNIPVKITNGQTRYLGSGNYLNIGNFTSIQLNAVNLGISVGTSDTPATDEDYVLGNTITSGLSGVVTNTHGMDNDDPYVIFNVVLSNSTSSDIIVKEIGYKQNLYGASSPNATSGFGGIAVLLDRTVLDTPLTVPARGNAALQYKLKCSYSF